MNRPIAAASAAESRSGTIKPVTSSVTTAAMPPAAVVTSGRAGRERLEQDVRQAVDVAAVVAH